MILEAGQLVILPGHALQHRLLCGNAFAGADVRRLVRDTPIGLAIVDPPFTPGDTWRDVDEQWQRVWGALELVTPARVALYCSWVVLGSVLRTARAYDLAWVYCLAEANTEHTNLYVKELVVYGARQVPTFRACGVMRMADPTNPAALTRHPAEKRPDALRELLVLVKHEALPPALYDPFAGSGIFLETAEAAGIAWYGMERDLAICQAIVDRWTAGAPYLADEIVVRR